MFIIFSGLLLQSTTKLRNQVLFHPESSVDLTIPTITEECQRVRIFKVGCSAKNGRTSRIVVVFLNSNAISVHENQQTTNFNSAKSSIYFFHSLVYTLPPTSKVRLSRGNERNENYNSSRNKTKRKKKNKSHFGRNQNV